MTNTSMALELRHASSTAIRARARTRPSRPSVRACTCTRAISYSYPFSTSDNRGPAGPIKSSRAPRVTQIGSAATPAVASSSLILTRSASSGSSASRAAGKSARSSATRAELSKAAPKNSAEVSTSTDLLDWNRFFRLRKIRRRYNLAASAVTSAGTTLLGVSILSSQDLDALGGGGSGGVILGLDPVVVLGLATAGFGVLGWLAGPFFGNSLFGLVNSRIREQIAMREREFFARIKRYRVDPSSQSFSNPVPDYYGEKIGSVADYRRWLKDQRAYNKKRQSFV